MGLPPQADDRVSTSRNPVDPGVRTGQPDTMTVLHNPLEFFGEASLQAPSPLYDRLRDAGPLHRVGDSAFYVVPGWEVVEEAVARVEDFSSNLTATMVYQPDGTVTSFDMEPLGGATHVLATADDPAHAVHRKILLPQL